MITNISVCQTDLLQGNTNSIEGCHLQEFLIHKMYSLWFDVGCLTKMVKGDV